MMQYSYQEDFDSEGKGNEREEGNWFSCFQSLQCNKKGLSKRPETSKSRISYLFMYYNSYFVKVVLVFTLTFTKTLLVHGEIYLQKLIELRITQWCHFFVTRSMYVCLKCVFVFVCFKNYFGNNHLYGLAFLQTYG